MWSVGISVSPSVGAERLGYDERQINRIVIRMAQYFLDREMRIIFGHDWREDGVMRAVADFASVVAARIDDVGDPETQSYSSEGATEVRTARMINLVPARRDALSGAALEAERDSGGVLDVIAISDMPTNVSERVRWEISEHGRGTASARGEQLTQLRHCLTILLDPGCRVCLGGRTDGYQGDEPGVMEEARLALMYGKPLHLMGGFGGATRLFGAEPEHGGKRYWAAKNGLTQEQKQELFETTDVDWALRLISRGIQEYRELNRQNLS